jgi:hypothetical protein
LHKKFEKEGKFKASFQVETTPKKDRKESVSKSPEKKRRKDRSPAEEIKHFDLTGDATSGPPGPSSKKH